MNTVILHLDNDRAECLCSAALKGIMQKNYKIVDNPPSCGKDFNDFLQLYLGIPIAKIRREKGG